MKDRGYTLYELCFVIAIVAILGSLSVPALSKTMTPTATERESKKIAHWLELIALKAAYKQDDVVITQRAFELFAYGLKDPKKPISKRVISPTIRVTLGRESLRFYHSGVCTPATVRINGADGSCLVRLSLRGRVSLECQRS